ncbi:hypothetical protein KU406_23225, partial [Salmonella enterica subsp. enterica serovar Montevideo]|nr:hypothetical protein [Salmonella enterica subsp. enterica serovar Montevideo]
MFGSVAVIRESGVHSLRVGDIYYVGHLPWFERLWYALANHPVPLAVTVDCASAARSASSGIIDGKAVCRIGVFTQLCVACTNRS